MCKNNYGYCPKCGGAGKSRERRLNGYDTCVNDHRYLSSESLESDSKGSDSKGSVYMNPECLKSMSYNKALEASGRLPSGGSYVWPTDPMCDILMNELVCFANVSCSPSSASVIIDVDVDMTKVPLDKRQLIVSVNSQYGFTRRELEAVRSKLDGTESACCDLSARVASSVGLLRITKSKLESLGLSEEVISAIEEASCVD